MRVGNGFGEQTRGTEVGIGVGPGSVHEGRLRKKRAEGLKGGRGEEEKG